MSCPRGRARHQVLLCCGAVRPPGAAGGRVNEQHLFGHALVTGLIWNTLRAAKMCPLSLLPDTDDPNMIVRIHPRQTCSSVATAPGVNIAPHWKMTQCSSAGEGTNPVLGAWDPTQQPESTNENGHKSKESPCKPNVHPTLDSEYRRVQNTETGKTSAAPSGALGSQSRMAAGGTTGKS